MWKITERRIGLVTPTPVVGKSAPAKWTHTFLLRQNHVPTSFWRNNDVFITSCVRWAHNLAHITSPIRESYKRDPHTAYFMSLRRNHMMTSPNGNIFRVTGPLCGEFTGPGPGEFPTQKPVTRSFDVFFDLRLNKRLSKQPGGWWFETLSWSLWCHCNE